MKTYLLCPLLLVACSAELAETSTEQLEQVGDWLVTCTASPGYRECKFCWTADSGQLVCLIQKCTSHYCTIETVQTASLEATQVALSGLDHAVYTWSLSENVRQVPSPDELTSRFDVRGARDLDGDGTRDLYWELYDGYVLTTSRSPTGENRGQIYPSSQKTPLEAVGDLDGDLAGDLLRRATSGQLLVTFGGRAQDAAVTPTLDTTWTLVGAGDFDGNRKDEVVWRKGTEVRIWNMNGATLAKSSSQSINAAWTFGAIGDFDGDGKADILWRDTANSARIWKSGLVAQSTPSFALSSAYVIEGAQDVNDNARAELLLRNSGLTGVQYQSLGTQYVEGGVAHGPEYRAH